MRYQGKGLHSHCLLTALFGYRMKQIHLTESNKQAEAMREGDEENVKVNPNFFLHALQWDKPQFYYHKIFDISVIIIAL